MEEKVLVRSEHYNSVFVWIFPLILAFILALRFITWKIEVSHPIWFLVWGIILLGLIIYFWIAKMELVVTNKRVYGKATFGKRVDLPLDSISAVGTSWLKGIDVGTSSGSIHFKLVKNQSKIHSALSELLMSRQNDRKSAKETVSLSNADELKKYKELMDIGAITQEEFEAKKKQLLDL